MHPMPRVVVLAAVVALPLTGVAACGSASGDGATDAIAVTATDDSCEVAKTDLAAGTHTFAISNEGQQVTEVYVFAPGDKVVTERENIGPGTKTELSVELKQGTYEIACKPGMTGDGIRQRITVSGQAESHASSDPRLAKAAESYRAYVQEQVDDTIPKVEAFVAAVKAGNVAKAKELYAPSRVGWERVEPVAESFGDIDPKVDLRERDLEAGQEWTGWHRIEKALWAKDSADGMGTYADRLVADVKDLDERVEKAEITPTSMANGAKELLDEVATGKVTGEEEAFSHTDLTDFAANVAGAKKVYELLRPVVAESDATLAKTLDEEFADVTKLLSAYEDGSGYVSYDTVTQAQRKELSDAVNALAEPLSRLAAAVVA